jgi:hypothetical protein
MVRETKRNGTKKILNIKKRNETKRNHLGNETKRNDKKITFSNPWYTVYKGWVTESGSVLLFEE